MDKNHLKNLVWGLIMLLMLIAFMAWVTGLEADGLSPLLIPDEEVRGLVNDKIELMVELAWLMLFLGVSAGVLIGRAFPKPFWRLRLRLEKNGRPRGKIIGGLHLRISSPLEGED